MSSQRGAQRVPKVHSECARGGTDHMDSLKQKLEGLHETHQELIASLSSFGNKVKSLVGEVEFLSECLEESEVAIERCEADMQSLKDEEAFGPGSKLSLNGSKVLPYGATSSTGTLEAFKGLDVRFGALKATTVNGHLADTGAQLIYKPSTAVNDYATMNTKCASIARPETGPASIKKCDNVPQAGLNVSMDTSRTAKFGHQKLTSAGVASWRDGPSTSAASTSPNTPRWTHRGSGKKEHPQGKKPGFAADAEGADSGGVDSVVKVCRPCYVAKKVCDGKAKCGRCCKMDMAENCIRTLCPDGTKCARTKCALMHSGEWDKSNMEWTLVEMKRLT